MKLKLKKFKGLIKIKDLPRLFERYEIFVVILGAIVVFLVAGFIFYSNAYKITDTEITPDVSIPEIQTSLFEQILEGLEQKKQPLSQEPIIDPFR